MVSTFSFTDIERAGSEPAGLSTVLFLSRVLPLAIVTIFCLLAVPVRRYLQLIKSLGSPPCLFWAWYAGVAIVSGFVSGITPTWSAWKCTEILVVVLWAASLLVHVQKTQSTRVMERVFTYLVIASYLVCLWAIAEVFREGHSIQDYVFRNYRMDTEWPHINSITLSLISLFAIAGGILLTNRIGLPTRVFMMMPVVIVFAFSRSRTGLLAMFTVALFSMKTSTISRGKKLSFIALTLLVVGMVASSQTVREKLRLSSWDELKRGAGRIRAESGGSGWGDTARLITKNPSIGIGFVIVKRFLDKDHLAVDNFVLQSLVVGGLVGAGPMLIYSLFAFLRWLVRVRVRDVDSRRLAEMGLLASCLGFVKSLTTNGMSGFGFALMLFLFGALAMRIVTSDVIRVDDSDEFDDAESPAMVGSV